MEVKTRSPAFSLFRTTCLVAGLLFGLAAPSNAQECMPLDGDVPPVAVVPMLDAVTVQPSRGEEPVAFQEVQKSIALAQENRVYLSSTADGIGWLSTDDQVQVRSALGRTWAWDFRDEHHTQIVPIPPQDISHLFEPGENEVTLTLTDLTNPEFSSRAYYLVIFSCPVEEEATAIPTATATHTPSPTSTESPTATSTATASSTPSHAPTTTPSPTTRPTQTPVPTETSTSTMTATQTLTPMPTDTPTATATTAIAMVPKAPQPPAKESHTNWLPWVGGSLLALLLLTGLLWPWFNAGQRLVGEIEVYRNGRFLHSVSLADQSKRRLTIGAKGDIVLVSENVPDVVAQLYAEQGEMCLDLYDSEDDTVADSMLLDDGTEIRLPDGYSLKYINPLTYDRLFEGEEYA